ncbi:LCP family protein [Actinocorallia populi]|uniref:LCP family protein n=1 Tax=Actinocorallia populi TaxID=2079200 RepID=UPI000D0952B0|nr:LCP family protein [Actinocorallia populi]
MAGDDDPIEQYFRPRPAGAEGPGGPVADDSGSWDAVAVDSERAPKVKLDPPRGRRRAGGPGSAREAVRRRRNLLATASVSAVVLFASGTAWGFQEFLKDKIQTIDIELPQGSGPRGAMNILLAGVDKRDGMSEADIKRLHLGREAGARSDTMMLMHVSEDRDKVTVVSLPRDTLVTIPAHKSTQGRRVASQQGKLTWAYSYGGAQLMKDTVEAHTGLVIDHYVEVNFLGFLKVVDAVGGVEVCTEQPIDDRASGLKLSPGKHHVDGATALAYARVRHGLGEDIGRMQRQQAFVSSLLRQSLAKVKDPVRGTRVLSAMLGAVRVDEGLKKHSTELADQFKDLSLDDVKFVKVPLKDPAGTALLGGINQSVVLWDEGEARSMFRKIDRDEPLVEPKPAPAATEKPLTVPPEQIDVRVRNGTGVTGVAKKASAGLTAAGFRAPWVTGVVQRRDIKPTLIRYGPSRADSARTLAASIPFAELQKVDALGSGIEVVVGSDWARPKKVETAAEAKEPDYETRTATQNLCG